MRITEFFKPTRRNEQLSPSQKELLLRNAIRRDTIKYHDPNLGSDTFEEETLLKETSNEMARSLGIGPETETTEKITLLKEKGKLIRAREFE